MTDPDKKHSSQRDEIKLYMDKSFQSSLGYFAAILALFALSKTEIAVTFAIESKELLSISTLLTNWSYLILICSCLFAIQKRVLFILCTGHSLDRDWEIFSQDPSEHHVWEKRKRYSWKIDSYFVAPVLILILCISVLSAYVGWSSPNIYVKIIIVALLHAIPIWMICRMLDLSSECGRQVERSFLNKCT
jgi:hypothetical protein